MNAVFEFTDLKAVPITHGVYKIVCVATGQFYVGSTAGKGGFRYRLSRHISYLQIGRHANRKLQLAFAEYGTTAFQLEILQEVENPDQVLAEEQHYLNGLKPFGKRGFNILPQASSSLGSRHTEESKRKMSMKRRGRSEKWKAWHRQLTTKATKDMWKIPGRRESIMDKQAMDFELEKDGQIFKGRNLSEFSRQNGLIEGHLSHVLAGKLRHHKGWTLPGKSVKPHQVRSPDGIIFEVPSVTHFARQHGLNQSCLNELCLGRCEQHKGWTLVSEPGPAEFHIKNL